MRTTKRGGRLAPARRPDAARSPPALEWVEDAAGQCARATVIGSRSLLVENHTGILAFSATRVRLDTGAGRCASRAAACPLRTCVRAR